MLGTNCEGDELPFLFKVLAAAEPLSLQAHPNSNQARLGFDEEERQGVPHSARHRNYKDASPKPELVLALTTFDALSGFRTPDQCLETLDDITHGCEDARAHSELLQAFGASRDSVGLERYFKHIFSIPAPELLRLTKHIESHCAEAADPSRKWLSTLAKKYPGDPGVLGAALLNHIRLSPGEAIFLPAGNLHAYLSGLSLEVMASSDNVLRGGLTSKHVDVDELNRVLRFDPFHPEILKGESSQSGSVRAAQFRTEAKEFELTLFDFEKIDLEANSFSSEVNGPEIWLGLEGEIYMEQGGLTERLKKGDQIFVSPGEPLLLFGRGRAARASLPR